MLRPRVWLAAVAAAALTVAVSAQGIRDSYQKYEYMIPMRDGVKLYTAVYVPKDKPGTHPILMQRTPYSAGPYGPNNYKGGFGGSPKMIENGFIFAYQDVRGKYMSEGTFENMRPQLREYLSPHDIDESTDTYDTVEFLINNVPNNNRRVGLWGISYPGGYAALGAINSHPALKAASPQAPTSDWFIGDDFHHNGAFFLQDAFNFYGGGFGAQRPVPSPSGGSGVGFDYKGDAYKFFLEEGPISALTEKYMGDREKFWAQMMEHNTYDPFWQNRSVPKSMVGVTCAVLTVGGWFDAEDCWGPPNVYRYTERQNPNADNFLVMGPWFHGMWAGRGNGQFFGGQDFGSDTSNYFQENVEWPFFARYLLPMNSNKPAEATVFETGANEWRTFNAWPPTGLKKESLHFSVNNKLTMSNPVAQNYRYTSDPNNPVPYQGGTLVRRTREYMLDDQRFAATRPDVVTLQTDPLTEDITMAGPLWADLAVTISGEDCDFIVKVIDVFPNGAKGPENADYSNYQMLVRGEVMRGKFRNSFSNPQPFTPGQRDRVRYEMPDVFHTFKKGHRIMVQVQSSWFPLVSLNSHKFQNLYKAPKSDFQPCDVTIHAGPDGSRVEFGRLQ